MYKMIIWRLKLALMVVGLAAACQPIQAPLPAQPATATERGVAHEGPAATAAGCPVLDLTTEELATGNADPLALLLASVPSCPTDAFALRDLLLSEGAQIETAMVANRGFHNPALGSFSLFEMVSGRLEVIATAVERGEFFFGHFTAPRGSTLIADQDPSQGSLMVELIVWDPDKEVFNFYELRGNGASGTWVYNGDSFDILADVSLLHRQPNPASPQFGQNLRCSGCHIAGGPILKELAPPYNDWWTVERGLDFGGRRPDAGLATIVGADFGKLVDASELAAGVLGGLDKLQTSAAFQTQLDSLTWQEQLRPLFCPVELNLETDQLPLDEDTAVVQIPSAFFVDPRLAQGAVTIDKAHYLAALAAWDARFPEIDSRDGNRAWETPVKATSDILAVQRLIEHGLVDEEFVFAVLAVDMTNPALSLERCGLLRLLPEERTTGWTEEFEAALAAVHTENPAAALLLDYLTDPEKDSSFQRAQAEQLLETCQERLQDEGAVVELFGLLAQRRAEVLASEISRNRRGQILEPGFRVIFPTVSRQPPPWSTRLTSTCEIEPVVAP